VFIGKTVSIIGFPNHSVANSGLSHHKMTHSQNALLVFLFLAVYRSVHLSRYGSSQQIQQLLKWCGRPVTRITGARVVTDFEWLASLLVTTDQTRRRQWQRAAVFRQRLHLTCTYTTRLIRTANSNNAASREELGRVGTRPWPGGCFDTPPSRIITDYRLSQKLSISAGKN